LEEIPEKGQKLNSNISEKRNNYIRGRGKRRKKKKKKGGKNLPHKKKKKQYPKGLPRLTMEGN